MNEKPIIFSTDSIKALLENRKHMTRRVIKPQPIYDYCHNHGDEWYWTEFDADDDIMGWWPSYDKGLKSKIQPGDILWVKETWCEYVSEHVVDDKRFAYKASIGSEGEARRQEYIKLYYPYKWRSPRYMPRAAARIFLRVKDVRVERLNEISQEDAKAEGIYEIRPNWWFFCDPATTSAPNCTLAATPKQAFMWFWNFLYRKDPEISWAMNHFVFVYSFERIDSANE